MGGAICPNVVSRVAAHRVVLGELRRRDHEDQRAPPTLLCRDHLAHFVHVHVLDHSELVVLLRDGGL